MVILDTNVFIYLVNGTLPRTRIISTDITHASVTKIEALGFSRIHVGELQLLQSLFAQSYSFALTDVIIDRAVKLRQLRRMSLGDSIVAATALEHDLELWTANTEDFQQVEGLRLVNPLEQG